MSYLVIYGETMPVWLVWQRVLPSLQAAIDFALQCEKRGDIVFSIALKNAT